MSAAAVFLLFALAARSTLGLLVALLSLTLAVLWLDRHRAPALVWNALTAGGLLVWTGIEVFYLEDFLQGGDWYRMNTVFKFGLQSWILLGLGCAGLVYLLVERSRQRALRATGATLVAFLLVASLVYPVYGSMTRLRLRFPEPPPGLTLDGEAFMKTAWLENASRERLEYRYDYEAVKWMRDHIERPETFAEASIGPYRGHGSRISMFTGLPAVLGWDNHEGQQRYPEEVRERHQDLRQLYDSASSRTALEAISKYGIRFVYVGTVERFHEFSAPASGAGPIPYASAEGLAKFDQLVGPVLRVAYQNPGVRIYEVKPSWQWDPEALEALGG